MAYDLIGNTIQKVELNVTNSSYGVTTKVFAVKQKDVNSRIIHAKLKDANGYIDCTGCTVQLNATLPDMSKVCSYGKFEDGEIKVRIARSMLEEAGSVSCDISVIGECQILDVDIGMSTGLSDVKVDAELFEKAVTFSGEYKFEYLQRESDNEMVWHCNGVEYETLDSFGITYYGTQNEYDTIVVRYDNVSLLTTETFFLAVLETNYDQRADLGENDLDFTEYIKSHMKEFCQNMFLRYDTDEMNLLPSQQQNVRTNIDVYSTGEVDDVQEELQGNINETKKELQSKINEEVYALEDKINAVSGQLNKYAKSFVFDNYEQFVNWLTGMYVRADGRKASELIVGTDILFKDTTYPAMWCNSTTKEIYSISNFTPYRSDEILQSISVNGTKKEIKNKNVDIEVPSKTSELENDRFVEFSTSTQGLNDLQKYNARSNIGALAVLTENSAANDFSTKTRILPKTNDILEQNSLDIEFEKNVGEEVAVSALVKIKENGLDFQDKITGNFKRPTINNTEEMAFLSDLGEYYSKSDVYNKQEVDAKIVNVYNYKGSVETYDHLPVEAVVGDVYDVKSQYLDFPPGTNYAWNGSSWDALGGSFNTEGLLKYNQTQTLTDENKLTARNNIDAVSKKELEDAVAQVDGNIPHIKLIILG